jgi:Phage tail repeat like
VSEFTKPKSVPPTVITGETSLLNPRIFPRGSLVGDPETGEIKMGDGVSVWSALPTPVAGGAPDWTDITGKPPTFPPEVHTHIIGDVTGLQTALDGKQAAGTYANATHTHVIADTTGLQTALDGKQSATLGEPTLWRALDANVAGANTNTVQPWFPSNGAVTLSVGTYTFKGMLFLNSGTTSHSVGLSFGGTATKTGMWQGRGVKSALGTAATAESTNADTGAISTNRTVTAANTTGPAQILVLGLIRVSVGGTFIPQFTYSAAPGSSSVLANTWFGLWRWDATGTSTSKGTWG